jgi:hypothetical protein
VSNEHCWTSQQRQPCEDLPVEGWLCPALFQYFEKAQRSFT